MSGDSRDCAWITANSLVNTNRDIWIGYFVALHKTRHFRSQQLVALDPTNAALGDADRR
jgi:hypothetical protein